MINTWNLLWIIPAAVSLGAICGVLMMALLQINNSGGDFHDG